MLNNWEGKSVALSLFAASKKANSNQLCISTCLISGTPRKFAISSPCPRNCRPTSSGSGSKRQSLTELSKAFGNENYHYIEPFAGSAALFFSLGPQSGLLADLNSHLINAMRSVRDRPLDLYKKLAAIPRNETQYYSIRNQFNEMQPHGIESAVNFVFLNRNCFNGLWRTNKSGKFNVPYGGTKMGAYPPLELFETCAQNLKKVSLRHQDFRKTIASAKPNSIIYADPPYFTSTERTFIEYGKKSFGRKDLDDLVDVLLNIDLPKRWKIARSMQLRQIV